MSKPDKPALVIFDNGIKKSAKGFVKPGHKYIRREKDKHGEYEYFYQEPGEVTVKQEVTEDQKSAILQILQILAGMCDGARKLDDMGFNKFDADWGAKLAMKEKLTDSEAKGALKLAIKYQRQYPASLLQRAKGEGLEKEEVKMKLALDADVFISPNPKHPERLSVFFDFAGGDAIRLALKSKFQKNIYFDWDTKSWVLDPSKAPEIFDLFKNIVMTDAAKALMEASLERKMVEVQKKLTKPTNIPQSVIDWKMNVLSLNQQQISMLQDKKYFDDWKTKFFRSVVGKNYNDLSPKQQRIVDEGQKLLNSFLGNNLDIKLAWYPKEQAPAKSEEIIPVQAGEEKKVGIAELLSEKNNDALPKLPWVNYDVMIEKDIYGFQKKGINWLLKVKRGILGFYMGLGKTLVGMVASQMVPGDNKKTICIVPQKTLFGWEAQINKFLKGKTVTVIWGTPAQREEQLKLAKNSDFVITTYGMLQKNPNKLLALNPRTVIIDEAHRLAGFDTVQGENFDKYFKDVEYKFLMTGSPIPNRPPGYYTMINRIKGGFLGRFWADFAEKYCVVEQGKWGKYITGYHNLVNLRDRTKHLVFIKTEADEDVRLELPPCHRPELVVGMEADQKKFYDKIQEGIIDYVNVGPKGNQRDFIDHILTQLRLEQAAISPKLIDPDYKGSSVKIELTRDMIEEHFESQLKDGKDTVKGVVVFSHFLGAIEILKDDLIKNKVCNEKEIAVIKGAINAKQAREVENGLNTGKYKILISSKAGQEGLNLQENANLMIHLDTPWTPKDLVQREHRIYRIGQPSKVMIYRPMVEDSIDFRKDALVKQKQAWNDIILRGMAGEEKELPDIDMKDKIDLEDIVNLLGIKGKAKNVKRIGDKINV